MTCTMIHRVLWLALALSTASVAGPRASASGRAQAGPADASALRAAAESGDAKAQLAYAKAIAATARDESRRWAQKAADQGLGAAWFWLGYTGVGDTTPFYEKAAEAGEPEAFGYLLDALLFRAGPQADVAKAKRFADLARHRHLTMGSDDAARFATVDLCADAGAPEIPAGDRPTPAEAHSPAFAAGRCWPYREGVGATKDLSTYGRCVLAQDPVDNNDAAELYANGWGVKPERRLALALICHGGSVPAELIDMVTTLHDAINAPTPAADFRFCDHVTSGMNGGVCAAEAEEIAAARRGGAAGQLTAHWSKPQKTAFTALQTAAEAFFTAHSRSEVDLSGSARAAIAIAEEAAMRDGLLTQIRAFERGRLPPHADLVHADAALNAAYGAIMRRSRLDGQGTVTKAGIKATQRHWLRYRDAYARFGAARYPQVAIADWRAWLSIERTSQLQEFVPKKS